MRVYYAALLKALAAHFGVSVDTPFQQTPEAFQRAVLFGTGEEPVTLRTIQGEGRGKKQVTVAKPFEGVLPQMQNLFETTKSELTRQRLRAYQSPRPCPACGGARLKPEILAVTLSATTSDGAAEASAVQQQLNIRQFCAQTIGGAREFLLRLQLTGQQRQIAAEIVREIGARLGFLSEVGLDYLTLDRESGTLSGGESQRIRLAAQIGSGLAGVLYVLDEPSIGLHQRDTGRLIAHRRIACAISGTPWSSSSTTRTRFARRITL